MLSDGNRLGAAPRLVRTIAFGISILLSFSSCIRDAPSDPDTASLKEKMESLPYLTWVAADADLERRGVTYHNPNRSSPGLNLYSPRNLPTAFLLDLEGNTVHSWSAPIQPGDTWQHVELLDNGELLAIVTERRLLKVAADSSVIWSLDLPLHHDVAVSESGRLYSLLREERIVEREGESLAILDDLIALVTADGKLEQTISLFDLFGDDVSEHRWSKVKAWLNDPENAAEVERRRAKGGIVPLPHGTPPDVLHANTVEVLTRDLQGVGHSGDLLISIRELDLIAIVDLDPLAVVWQWGPGTLRRQHQPTVLANNNILIFDNKGAGNGGSRVLELEPLKRDLVWSYMASPPEQFFTGLRGGSQRLPNGNTLITESSKGRVFEITPGGEIVWEYYVPFINKRQKTRASIYRMTRLPISAEDISWASGETTSGGP